MIVFWIVAALFVAGALLFLLPGLWKPQPGQVATSAGGVNVAVYRDQLAEIERDLAADLITPERFEQARAEIQRRVLEDTTAATAPPAAAQPSRVTAIALAVLIPLASVATYLVIGEPDAVAPVLNADRREGGKPGEHAVSAEQIQKMVGALAEKLKTDPDNAEGWMMLGRSYSALGRYRDAAGALRKASELLPRDVNVLADLADVLGMAQGRRLAGEPARIVQRALDLDPRHVKALALAGSVAFEAKDYAAARGYWERLVAVVPPDSDIARSVRGSIAEATQLEGGGAAPAPPAAATAQAPAAPAIVGAAATVSGQVVLSPELVSRIAPGDTLYVFARAANGPRLPLAIVKRTAGELPLEFKLDDSMAMDPQFKLSGFAQVVVGARISRSGNATPQSGDLVGQTAPVAPGAQGLKVVIDAVQP